MKALQGNQGRPELIECDVPRCEAGQVRIRVVAAGINRADLLQAAGLYPPPPGVSHILGLECAGIISEVSEGSRWQVGDRVCALLAGGGMAQEVCVDARHVLPVPQGLSLLQAAAIPEVYATAWLNIFQLAKLQPGEKVLLHAGASGVGSAAIQLCKAFHSPCWVSVGSAERLAYCQALGAEGGVIRGDNIDGLQDFAPFDVILDPVGASYAALNLKILGLVQLIGSTLRSRSDAFKGELIAQLTDKVWPLFSSGALDPQVEEVFAWTDAEAAFAQLASNQVNGKVVLQIASE